MAEKCDVENRREYQSHQSRADIQDSSKTNHPSFIKIIYSQVNVIKIKYKII